MVNCNEFFLKSYTKKIFASSYGGIRPICPLATPTYYYYYYLFIYLYIYYATHKIHTITVSKNRNKSIP